MICDCSTAVLETINTPCLGHSPPPPLLPDRSDRGGRRLVALCTRVGWGLPDPVTVNTRWRVQRGVSYGENRG